MQKKTSRKPSPYLGDGPERRRKAALRRGDKYYHIGCGQIGETLIIVQNRKIK